MIIPKGLVIIQYKKYRIKPNVSKTVQSLKNILANTITVAQTGSTKQEKVDDPIPHIGIAVKLVLIYKSDGLPIYSRCFGDFCLQSSLEPALVTSFLDAIAQFSEEFMGNATQLKKIEFYGMEMNFRKLHKTNINLVLVMKNSSPSDIDIIDEISFRIDDLISEHYLGILALGVENTYLNEFVRDLECEVLNPWLHYTFPETDMKHSTHCPYCQNLILSDKFSWKDKLDKRIISQYSEIHNSLKRKPELIPEVENKLLLAKVRKRINPDC